ncbi:MAG: methyltransferase domain-containing protein [Myxococcales bacterium]|nr:methyltransferase domain-containing protein [Myxococcales bacterium]
MSATLSTESRAAAFERIRTLYDAWSPEFVAAAGTTFQSGLVKASADAPEDPDASTRLCAAAAGVRDGDALLDAGCGVGGPAVALLEAFPHSTLAGVTLSPVQARMAEALAAERGVSARASFAVADYHELPFPDAAFDVAFFFECTGYSPDPAALYREAVRVLKPGGRVYVKDVFRNAARLDADDERRMAAFDDLWACVRSGSLAEAEAHAKAAGLRVATRIYPHVGTHRFVGAMLGPDGRLNAFGRGFANSFAPIVFAELCGVKSPEVSTP